MKHARKALVFLFLLVTPLLLAGVLPPAINNEVKATISPIPTKVIVPSYEEQTPILAYNDFDMDNYASDLEWDGDGSPGNPYIIEGYNITSNSDSILIHDTTRAFEIRNCFITSFTSGAGNGIMIDNVTQAAIVDTFVMDKSDTIDVKHVPSLYIDNCTIYDGGSSVYIYNCKGVTITECVIYDNFDHGIYLNECNNSMISNNVINGTTFGAGIRLINSHAATIIGNQIFNCRASGVWAYLSPQATIEENLIHDNMYWLGPMCGVHLDQSPYASIVGNEIFDNSRNGIYVYNSDWVYIFDNAIYGNSDHGIDSMFSANGTIIQNDIHGNGWWPVMVNSLCGIYLGQTDDYVISDNTIWNNTPSGISLENADSVTITNNEIFNNTDFGIYGYGGHESVILENQIYGNGWSDTTPLDPCGIYLNEPTAGSGIGHNITNNEIYDNDGHGIYLVNAENHVVDSNIIHHNNFSIYVNLDGGVNVTNNIVFDNSIGILLESVADTWIYGNDFGWNDVNALDVSYSDTVYWTDNVSIGNWWSDYSGIGEYNITDDAGTDFFPSKSLDLIQPAPIDFEILETGNLIVWEASALNPSHYEVFVDGSSVLVESWDGNDIEFLADGLSHGSHTIDLEIYHISGHSMDDFTNANVEDLTSPSDIEGPIHITITVGDPITAQYSAEDPSGIEWSVNDTSYFAIDATGHLSNIADLSVGEYAVRIVALDPYGHSTFYVVTITVNAAPGLPPTIMLMIGAGGAIVVLVVFIVGYKTKRG